VLLATLHVIQERHANVSAIGILDRFQGRVIAKGRQRRLHPLCPVCLQPLVNVVLPLGMSVETGHVFLVFAARPACGFAQHHVEGLHRRGFVPDVVLQALFNGRCDAIGSVCGVHRGHALMARHAAMPQNGLVTL
jgi:hypothetical protein